MTGWMKPGAPQAVPGKRALAALILGSLLAIQGCTNKEAPGASAPPARRGASHARPLASGARVLQGSNGSEYVAGQLLVRFKKGAGHLTATEAHALRGAQVLHTYRSHPGLQLVSVPEASLKDALASYLKDPSIEHAEPNFVYRISALPNDARFGELWGLHNTGQSGGTADVDINAPEAWELTQGSGPSGVVAVIDTGIDYTHPELKDNLWTNPGEIPGNHVDDDGNGYIDDIHGINAITRSGDPMDDNEHGTHCAGTIAGRGNNSTGVVGVNWSAQLMACKFLDSGGSGTLADAVTCLEYIHQMKTRALHPVNVIATNNSWGGGSFSQELQDAVIQQRDDGILFVAAAGNNNTDNDTLASYPGSYFLSNIISVAAHDRSDTLASFSNYGQRTVHLAAPGVGILSSVPGGKYDSFDGTSMAAPHVSGVIGLLKAQDPGRDWRQIKNLVLAGAVSSTAAQGKTLTGSRLRASDSAGKGSLTCNNQVFSGRVRPLLPTASVGVQEPLQIVAYHIRCDAPAGALTVTVTPGNETFLLQDNGQHGDEVAGDGMYTGYFEPGAAGTYTLSLPESEPLTVHTVLSYVRKDIPAEWRSFTGTSLAQGDDTVTPLTSPFPIPFAQGPGQTLLNISMNGALSFTSDNIGFHNSTLPAAPHATLVAPFWDDLYPGPAAENNVHWGVLGTAPHRELVVEWRNIHHRDTRAATPADTLNFQVVFFEDSSDVLFNYRDVLVNDSTLDNGASATVGVQTADMAAVQHSSDAPTLKDNTSLLWRIQTPSTEPVVQPLEASPATLTEGDTVTVTTTFSDADGATGGPWTVQFDTDFPGWFTPDATQEVTQQGAVSASAPVLASGTVLVAVRVTDATGTRSTVEKFPLTVADVAPVLGALTAASAPQENKPTALSVSFTDPGLDAPWKVEWDFNHDGLTFSADRTSLATRAGRVTLEHTFPQDGTFTVAARVTDKDGVQSNIQVLDVTVEDLSPALSAIRGDTSLKEGSTFHFLSSFSNPGDNAKPWKVQWDHDYDGTTFTVDAEESRITDGDITLSGIAADSGQFQYALRVVDADGSVSDVQTLTLDIAEVNPEAKGLTARLLTGRGKEPSTMTFDLSARSGAQEANADPLQAFLWDFEGDGTFDALTTAPYALHAFRDNPAGGNTFTTLVRVMDEDSFTDLTVPVTIDNVPPALTLPPRTDAMEGRLLALRLTATDPGADTLAFSVSNAPAGLNVTEDGLLLWTPHFQQSSGEGRTHIVTVTVTDDDGASDSQPITLTVWWKDADGDGMADSWEVEHGLDPTRHDADEDRDGDGVSNLTEFLSETGGPRIPEAAVAGSPLSGEQVNAPQLVLTTQNVKDVGNLSTVRYQFQLFSDRLLTRPIRDVTVDQVPGAATSATLTDGTESETLEDLQDNHAYAWRVRATDDALHGSWSEVQYITFNPLNDAPEAPRTAHPLAGTQVSTDRPTLVTDNALDADDGALSYVFELATDKAMTQTVLTSGTTAGGPHGSTAWTVTTTLVPFTTYYWRVTAADPHGATAYSDVSSFSTYLGRPSNREPGLPVLAEPSTDGHVSLSTPTLVAHAARDPDGDALSYVFELDTSATFSSPSRTTSATLAADPDGKVRWQTPALMEDTRYFWRTRALDGFSASEWSLNSFRVNTRNDAPSAPVALNPSDAILSARRPPTLRIQNAVDPEGDALTYFFEVRRTDGTLVATGHGLTEGDHGQTSFTLPSALNRAERYFWTAYAKDAAGAVGPSSAKAHFRVDRGRSHPEPREERYGGCTAGENALGGILPLVAMALGLIRLRRQPRGRRDTSR
ncbi:S8 family serine peptidase [Stigmatella sp. ncwal1]|uniref:S8 family serine peptidase n=1 Tax=Stigmatella ashevillensis TaxID=2995309 RepID=A0ABT5DMN9_9BACT|nr:S8 family serine peptidase [Stigmatella ashevillena]MDC0714925.1 S8 family serine peptidase [Stigmatella ashevillena]